MTSVDTVIHGHHVDISTRFKEHAIEKLARIDRFGVQINSVDLELSKEQNPRLADRAYKVELTCRGKGPVIRAEASSADKYSALDLAVDKLEEQLRRAHDKARIHKSARNAKRIALPDGAPVTAGSNGFSGDHMPRQDSHEVDLHTAINDDELYASGPMVVRQKTHATSPMTIAQAVSEMEMVGHDFYLFHEIESAAPAVVYRRRGFDYGLIRIETVTVAVAEG